MTRTRRALSSLSIVFASRRATPGRPSLPEPPPAQPTALGIEVDRSPLPLVTLERHGTTHSDLHVVGLAFENLGDRELVLATVTVTLTAGGEPLATTRTEAP